MFVLVNRRLDLISSTFLKRRREKAYPGMDSSYPGEINTAWNLASSLQAQALLVPQG